MKKIAINIDERRNADIKERVIKALRNAGLDYQVECFNNAIDIYAYTPDILIGHINNVNSELISNPPHSLKWFHAMSAGVDKALKNAGQSFLEHNIKFSNVKGIHSVAMREYVLGTMLYFEKNMDRWIEQKNNTEWNRTPLSCLSGKEMLVYGVGNIGKEVGKVANFLGMRVIGVSSSGRSVENFEKVYKPDMLKQCVKSADYIVIAAPRTTETESIFNKEMLSNFKRETVLINVSRGELIDEQCLADFLNAGRIRGAALDVFRQEPLPDTSVLWQCKNLVITPHISGYFSNGMALGIECFIDNLKEWRKTGNLVSEVSISKGY
ncbi:D-2-hydroxyacid dehydrogenase [Vreelandella populi]|uniref:D-2-hydroxyacid dehydrogenase n=1 Tax=Vreelandella populi TaxID=2498858 RepID=A0A3S0WKM8_9GAMM|nr:D-2-hydroxyacid dehydrogenase [Halomonas populi]RUR35565.1 D-2-hydroxyacid dehydrogenase [Halomonas populi]RUR47755.1 D-2-hydroxyacid dehydrogenase [Halomonas populi]RUR54382.1 D-2-hydroxyacid dehydrogenase [Halomonas populi]